MQKNEKTEINRNQSKLLKNAEKTHKNAYNHKKNMLKTHTITKKTLKYIKKHVFQSFYDIPDTFEKK